MLSPADNYCQVGKDGDDYTGHYSSDAVGE